MLPVISQPHAAPLAGTVNDWRRALGAHYLQLGRTSRQRRFMTVLPNRSISLIANRASPDIVLGIKADGRVIGVVEVFSGIDHHAEIGISVEDLYQGQGYGRALFMDGLVAADKIGVRTADLYFASENHGIRSLVHAAGGQVLQHGADCEAHIDIATFLASCD
ncbi:MAG: GNAT family N-acetyltransferase [Roseovarius sp.]|nr:GNAT family N-acetyltransferase [Roseovarius sp.]